MIVGAALVEIRVHESQSLKAKRGVVRSIQQRVRNRFNLAVSEVGGQGTWQLAQIGLCAVGSDTGNVRSVLQRAVEFIEDMHLAEVLDSEVEIVDVPHNEPDLARFELGDLPQDED
jgi:hypothetical protein